MPDCRPIILLMTLTVVVGSVLSEPLPDADHGLLSRYAGTWDSDSLLSQPAIQERLRQLTGSAMPHLMQNLDVRGAIDVVGGALSVSGNAPHQGTEEEAVVCVGAGGLRVEAALISAGTVTVYMPNGSYENLSLCIKDWITLVNSRHVDRLRQPANVRLYAN